MKLNFWLTNRDEVGSSVWQARIRGTSRCLRFKCSIEWFWKEDTDDNPKPA